MAAITYQGREGILRFFDGSGTIWNGGGSGSAGTPYYFQLRFSAMNFTGPAAKPRPVDPIIVTAGGYVHSPSSEEYEAAFYNPLDFSFSCLVNDLDRVKLRDSLSNMDLNNPWTVGGKRWSSTKGKGSIIMPDGTFQGTRAFYDTQKVAVDMQLLFQSLQAASNFGMSYQEVYIAPQDVQIQESPDEITLAIKGIIYGNIGGISAFTTGVAV